jgi:TRAP-type C4-dicarboxylate transport system substrate-binding protein
MNIKFNFDDESAVFEVLDEFFVTMLKKELQNSKDQLKMVAVYPDDIEMYKRNIKACKVLLDYYT